MGQKQIRRRRARRRAQVEIPSLEFVARTAIEWKASGFSKELSYQTWIMQGKPVKAEPGDSE